MGNNTYAILDYSHFGMLKEGNFLLLVGKTQILLHRQHTDFPGQALCLRHCLLVQNKKERTLSSCARDLLTSMHNKAFLSAMDEQPTE